MKKFVFVLMAGLLLSTAGVSQAATSRGGLMGFISGCCFGVRSGAAYNDGKEIHWRQWIRLIPIVGLVGAVWDGVDGANGVTTSDYAKKYGSIYY